MEKLSEQQKKQLIEHMNRHENDSWKQHARWAYERFGIRLTDIECSTIYINSIV